MIAQTADGAYDPAGGRFGNPLVGLTKDLRINDSYTPANWDYLNRKDFDLGVASPTVFEFDKWALVAAAAKEGVMYLLDARNLGGDNHMTPLYVSPRFGNDALLFGYDGVGGRQRGTLAAGARDGAGGEGNRAAVWNDGRQRSEWKRDGFQGEEERRQAGA